MSAVTIRIAHADGRTEQRPLGEGTYQIGRDGGEIVLPDPDVSSRHARLDVHGGSVRVTDLGSTNGTLDASGYRIGAAHPLAPNQSVRLGRSQISVVPATLHSRGGRTRVMPQFVAPASAAPAATTVQPARPERPWRLFASAAEVSRGRALSVESWTTTTTTRTTSYDGNGNSWTNYSVTTHYWQRIWYRMDSGRDVSWTFRDANIDLLPGHRIAVIYDAATSRALRFVNCSTRYYWSVDLPSHGLVSRFFRRIGGVIGAGFFMLPLLNVFGALMWLREAFGKKGRWHSGVLTKLLAAALLLAVFGSYTWALPLVIHPAPGEASAFVVPVEVVARIEMALARTVASDLFSSLAPLTGANEADVAGLVQSARLETRDADWLSEEAFIAKYHLQAIDSSSERFSTHIAAPVSALCSLIVFLVGAALFQLKLTMHYWFARALDKRSNEEMT